MAVTAFTSGSKLRASRLNELITYMTRLNAEKSTDTSRSSATTGTTRVADPHLVIAMAANTTYDLTSLLIGASAANGAGHFSGEWQYPSDAIMSFTAHGLVSTLASGTSADLQAGAVALDATSPAGPFVIGLSTSNSGTVVKGRITTVTAGNLTLAWGQSASNANNSTLRAGSYMTLEPTG